MLSEKNIKIILNFKPFYRKLVLFIIDLFLINLSFHSTSLFFGHSLIINFQNYIYFILLLILGVENSFAIAFICAILNIIPYLGPLISIFLMIILSATNNIDAFIFNDFLANSIWLLVGFTAIQMLDNFIIQPYIFS